MVCAHNRNNIRSVPKKVYRFATKMKNSYKNLRWRYFGDLSLTSSDFFNKKFRKKIFIADRKLNKSETKHSKAPNLAPVLARCFYSYKKRLSNIVTTLQMTLFSFIKILEKINSEILIYFRHNNLIHDRQYRFHK